MMKTHADGSYAIPKQSPSCPCPDSRAAPGKAGRVPAIPAPQSGGYFGNADYRRAQTRWSERTPALSPSPGFAGALRKSPPTVNFMTPT
jgi:hypothetical protein